MVVADPAAELLRLVTDAGDPAPSHATAADVRAAELVRRRFGLALPPPFVGEPADDEPIRVATAHDGAAIAAIKWRAFGTSYRGGVLDDAFLDQRDVVPPASFWVGRAMLPPTPDHRLLVWGRPGRAFGYADLGPVHDEDLEPGTSPAGEVYELYVDPTVQGRGGGARLLDAAVGWFGARGLGRAELSTIATNPRAQGFYRAAGWEPTGRVHHVDLGSVAFDEVRFARRIEPGRS